MRSCAAFIAIAVLACICLAGAAGAAEPVVIEDSATGEQGPLWVRCGIPVASADGTPQEVRNQVALCQCGRSKDKPFCDGRHIE